MTAYPFSGTVRGNIIDPFNANPIELIERYCSVFGLRRKDLFAKTKTGKATKKDLGLSLSSIRMALSYYIHENYNIGYSEVSYMVGYNDHSTTMKNEHRVRNYIDHKDSTFYPYWEKLLQVA
jgi:hypothetical protein